MSTSSPDSVAIRSTDFDELPRLHLIHTVSVLEKEAPETIDVKEIENSYPDSRPEYERNWHATGARYFVAEANFPTPYPVLDTRGHQLAGFASVRFNPAYQNQTLYLEDIFTLESPYKTGSILMNHVFEIAEEVKAERILLHAVYPNSVPYYAGLGFDFANEEARQEGTGAMALHRENFAGAKAKVNASLLKMKNA